MIPGHSLSFNRSGVGGGGYKKVWNSWEKDVCISFGFKLVRKFGAAPVQWPATGLILWGTEPQILERVFSPLPNYLEFLEIYMILKPRRTADHMFRLVVPT